MVLAKPVDLVEYLQKVFLANGARFFLLTNISVSIMYIKLHYNTIRELDRPGSPNAQPISFFIGRHDAKTL